MKITMQWLNQNQACAEISAAGLGYIGDGEVELDELITALQGAGKSGWLLWLLVKSGRTDMTRALQGIADLLRLKGFLLIGSNGIEPAIPTPAEENAIRMINAAAGDAVARPDRALRMLMGAINSLSVDHDAAFLCAVLLKLLYPAGVEANA